MTKWLVLAVKLIVAGALITWLITSGAIDFAFLGETLRTEWPWVAAAVVAFGPVMFCAALRWKWLLAGQELPYELRTTLRLTLVGMFFNQMMPGATGGDVVKAYYVARDHPGRRTAGVMTVIFDRALGLSVLALIAGIAVIANLDFVSDHPVLVSLGTAVWVGLFGLLVFGWLFYSDRFRGASWLQAALARLPLRAFLERLGGTIYAYKSHPDRVVSAFGVTACIHFTIVLIHWLAFHAVTDRVATPAELVLLVPLTQIAMAVPITPQSLGTAEWAYAELYGLAGYPRAAGASLCILYRIVLYSWALVGAVAYLAGRKRYGAVPAGGVEPEAETAEDGGDSEVDDARSEPRRAEGVQTPPN